MITLLLTMAVARADEADAGFAAPAVYLGLHGGANIVTLPWEFGMNTTEDGLQPSLGGGALAGVRVGFQLHPRVAIELGASALPHSSMDVTLASLADPGEMALSYDLDALVHFTRGPWAPFGLVGAGGYHQVAGQLSADFDPNFHVGLGVRGKVLPFLAVRLEARDVLSDGFQKNPSNNVELRAGIDIFPRVHRVKPPTEEILPEPAALPEEPPIEPAPVQPVAATPTPAEVPHPARVVWAPHPICAWILVTELASSYPDLSKDLELWVTEPGYLPATSHLEHAASATLVPAPPQGGVVVMATPGDVVHIGATALPVPDSSAIVLTAPLGPFEATVEGGGRRAAVEGAVADGYVLWLRTAGPAPSIVQFGSGSSRLNAAANAEVRAIAGARGGYGFDVQGGYSSEGNRALNEALASARAEAVRTALIEAGVPAEMIRLLPPKVPTGDGHPDDRIATILPRRADAR